MSLWSFAQQNIREEVYVHLSSNDLIAGETLHFSVFTRSVATGRLSGLSSLVYIELLDEAGDVVYRTKVYQEEGRAAGDIFLTTDLETGRYQLMAYTRWMKNFESYARQELTIVNPYKVYTSRSMLEPEVALQFFVEGGRLLAQRENVLLICARDQYGEVQPLKAKLLNGAGEKVEDVNFDALGVARVVLKPQLGERYQLAIETKDTFRFVDLPASCDDCAQLHVYEMGEQIRIKISSGEGWSQKVGQLLVVSSQGILLDQQTTLTTETLLVKDQLPQGALVAQLYVDGIKVNERLFWNGQFAHADRGVKTYSSRTKVTEQFELPKGSRVTVSAKKQYGSESPQSMHSGATRNSLVSWPGIASEKWTAPLMDDVMLTSTWDLDTARIDSVRYLPEFNSGIVQGKIEARVGELERFVNVALSFQGADFEIDATATNREGVFFLKYDPSFANNKGVVRILNDPEQRYLIEVYPEFYTQYPAWLAAPLQFDSGRLEQITVRSIANQIENAYFTSVKEPSAQRKFPEVDGMVSYVLDEYTRFSTMRDTFIELVYQVGVSKNENKYYFKMRTADIDYNDKYDVETMVLLDGAFSTAEDILNLSPYLVERIDVMNKRYFMGSVMFDGIISIKTFENDGGDTAPLGAPMDLIEVQPEAQVVGTDGVLDLHKPMMNDLLYWAPLVVTDSTVFEVSFLTSEVKGRYVLQIEGVAPDGASISKSMYFDVK
ncbi:hypothetical protein BFP72_04100 [Reichenbachiella sp. 5M10]|nr:hypothetical protein BFP72_04100 [Reichenbachiella sp. 5M10]